MSNIYETFSVNSGTLFPTFADFVHSSLNYSTTLNTKFNFFENAVVSRKIDATQKNMLNKKVVVFHYL